ncbi:hypothetical protein TEA_016873 [Camellia sinensis var. sinensis]|uniref:Peptidase A1 domain-containing protein n=1 Tax=Camellia sinensis var. sinensis TaxID=542762 RepID=A0A4S4CZJ4_CAMSN|nr:hypothetical protein TEA_016873 [Camellia sinensis var. sinensis]
MATPIASSITISLLFCISLFLRLCSSKNGYALGGGERRLSKVTFIPFKSTLFYQLLFATLPSKTTIEYSPNLTELHPYLQAGNPYSTTKTRRRSRGERETEGRGGSSSSQLVARRPIVAARHSSADRRLCLRPPPPASASASATSPIFRAHSSSASPLLLLLLLLLPSQIRAKLARNLSGSVAELFIFIYQIRGKGQRASAPPTVTEILTRDQSRVNSIQSRLRQNNLEKDSSSSNFKITTTIPANSGLSIGNPNYIVTIGLGTPKKHLSLIFDTGSSFTWIQC